MGRTAHPGARARQMSSVGSKSSKGVPRQSLKRTRPKEADRVAKPRRFHPGTVALREIRRYQQGTDNLIRRTNFQRLVREIAQDVAMEVRWEKKALHALQEGTEGMLIDLFKGANRETINHGRVTIMPSDLRMVLAHATHIGSRSYGRDIVDGQISSRSTMQTSLIKRKKKSPIPASPVDASKKQKKTPHAPEKSVEVPVPIITTPKKSLIFKTRQSPPSTAAVSEGDAESEYTQGTTVSTSGAVVDLFGPADEASVSVSAPASANTFGAFAAQNF